jgi:pimeloyl-ACP methyl ester carboxylesterase
VAGIESQHSRAPPPATCCNPSVRPSLRLLLRIVRGLVLAWLALAVVLWLAQRWLIYLPHATAVDAARTDFALDRGGVVLRGWSLNPGAEDALIYFGGNAERIELAGPVLAQALPGRVIYLLAYRGYGASEGRPGEAALVEDAVALYDEVRRRQPAARIALIGRSLGSGVASALAARRPVDALVLVTPFDSLAAVATQLLPFWPVRWLLRDRFDSVAALRDYPGPVLVIRAGRDAVIPIDRTDALVAALPGARVVDLAGAGHNDIDLDPAYIAAIADFLSR